MSRLVGGVLLASALTLAPPASAHDSFQRFPFGYQRPHVMTPYYYAPPPAVVVVPARPYYYPAPVYVTPRYYAPPRHHPRHHGGLTIVLPFGR